MWETTFKIFSKFGYALISLTVQMSYKYSNYENITIMLLVPCTEQLLSPIFPFLYNQPFSGIQPSSFSLSPIGSPWFWVGFQVPFCFCIIPSFLQAVFLHHASSLLSLLFNPEDGHDMLLQNMA
jgi:hypothetical protein